MTKPLIVLGTPCFGGQVGQGYMLSVLALAKAAEAEGIGLEIVLLGGDALISRARAVIAARFLDMPDATHLLFVDADISFEPDQVLRLLAADKDFAAAVYPLKRIDWVGLPARAVAGETLATAGLSYVGSPCEGEEARTDGDFVTARYAGTGFQLIRRTAFERLIAAHPELAFRKLDTPSDVGAGSDHLYALFDPIIDRSTGRYLSEDYAFCRRWRDIGGEIWLDRRSRLGHTGAMTFAGNMAARHHHDAG